MPWQKLSHFPASFEVGRKDKMYINHTIMKSKFGMNSKDLDFVPETYILPRERKTLEAKFETSPSWIIKPPASARGIGIKVLNKWVTVM